MTPLDALPQQPSAVQKAPSRRTSENRQTTLNVERIQVAPLSVAGVSIPYGLELQDSVQCIGPRDLPDKFVMSFAFPDQDPTKSHLRFHYSGRPLISEDSESFEKILSRAIPEGVDCSADEISHLRYAFGATIGRNQYAISKRVKDYSFDLQSCRLKTVNNAPMVIVQGSYLRPEPPNNDFYGAFFLIPGRSSSVGEIFVQGKLDDVKRGLLREVLQSIEWSVQTSNDKQVTTAAPSESR